MISQHSKRVTPTRYGPQSLPLLTRNIFTRELLQYQTHRSYESKMIPSTLFKGNDPTASSIDPCRNDLER